ncbi:hypothetical protein C8Q76DRAFT_702087 [Earliella scabrosa]|nr:hypothetical protein C8Q76DRAFT_702087 [Earliella scabrosa]
MLPRRSAGRPAILLQPLSHLFGISYLLAMPPGPKWPNSHLNFPYPRPCTPPPNEVCPSSTCRSASPPCVLTSPSVPQIPVGTALGAVNKALVALTVAAQVSTRLIRDDEHANASLNDQRERLPPSPVRVLC